MPDKENSDLTASEEFLSLFPPIPATATRIGNSSGGTTETMPTRGRSIRFHDGSPIRYAVPVIADRIGLETGPDGEVLLRVHSPWNEGGWHDTYIDPKTGKVLGGMWDVPFPRLDIENKTESNAWEFGTGWWIDDGFPGQGTTAEYRAGVPFTLLKQGADSGVPGYSWKSDAGGLVIKTPHMTIYGLVSIESAVTDPINGNLVFTQYNSHYQDWTTADKRGDGREQVSFAPSFDFTRYPTDPRRSPSAITHPSPFRAFRSGGTLYVLSAENEILLHKWIPSRRVMEPVAALYIRPDQLPASIPGAPTITWGQGVRFLADKTGNFQGDKGEIFNAGTPVPLWNGYLYDADLNGDVYFLPRWREIKDAGNGAKLTTLDPARGAFSPENIATLVMPDALKTAPACEQIRIEWKTGDLYAIVSREGQWNLERYPRYTSDPAVVKPAYSVGPVALRMRYQYDSWTRMEHEAFGTMAVLGGYVFIAEGQEGGLRIHRSSDGSIVGRAWSKAYTNSTIDNSTQIQVTETPTEFRIFLMDFHGKSTLVWRVKKADLKAMAGTK